MTGGHSQSPDACDNWVYFKTKTIEDRFKALYDGDPELRKVLEKSDVATFSVEEKYQIMEAYMQGGGAAGL